MAKEYIEREAVLELLYDADAITMRGAKLLNQFPAADVVPREQYTKLLKAAFAMHEWIFLNTADEEEAYAECGLTEEMNALLGYGGSVKITTQEGK